MRAYALVLGTLLTTGSAYVADVAVASTGLMQQHAPRRPTFVDAVPSTEIWYGGTIEPITITARRTPPLMLVTVLGTKAESTGGRARRSGS
jgi:hypothetical protein